MQTSLQSIEKVLLSSALLSGIMKYGDLFKVISLH